MLFLAKKNKRLFKNAIFAVVLNFLFVLYNTNKKRNVMKKEKAIKLEEFCSMIGSSKVNKAYALWKEFIDDNRSALKYTLWKPKENVESEHSLCFKKKADLIRIFELNDYISSYMEGMDSRILVLHSSALLPLLLFHSISPTNTIRISGIEYDDVHFEVPNKVFNSTRPSKIDVALISHKEQAVLYLESKFTEYLLGKSSNSFSDKYKNMVRKILGDNQPAEGNNQFYIRGKLDNIDIVYGEGIKQMIAHFIGVCKGGTSHNIVDVYIKKGYEVKLGCIVYQFNKEIDKLERLDAYSKLYKNMAEKMNELLRDTKRTGNGSILKECEADNILHGAPQNFTVIGELLTYQKLVGENKDKFNSKVLKFYELYK